MAERSRRSAPAQAGGYSADDMRELTGLDPIRQNPAQYIGDTSAVSVKHGKGNAADGENLTGGGQHLLTEVLGNSSDEAMNGYGDYIEVRFAADQSITVTDNGRGVPPDVNSSTGKTGIEMTFLTMNAGGKFKEKGKGSTYKTAQGLHGVGAACVAALSDRLDVTVWRDGREYRMSAKQGRPGSFADPAKIRSAFTPCKPGDPVVTEAPDKRPADEKKKFPHGTSVRWHPDASIWSGTDIPLYDAYRFVELQSYMVPNCVFKVIDEVSPGASAAKPKVTEYHHPGGIDDMVGEKTAKGTNISPIISFDVPAKYTVNEVIERDDGTQGSEEVEYGMNIRVSMRWTSRDGVDVEGYANAVHCSGKHVDGFRRGLSRGVGKWIKDNRDAGTKGFPAKKTDPVPDISDITDGMVAAIEVLLEEQCFFTSQTKETLNNAPVYSCVSDTVAEQIGAWLSARKNATAAKKIAKAVMDSARLRAKQKKEKEAAKKIKDTLGVSSKPAKLVDCQNEGPGTELLIAEGDSAGGTIKQARNGAWQALFPVRGVTLNCYGAKAEKILSNNEFADLANAMRGGGIGKYFDMDKRRYDRIGIYTDADEDGNYIRSLLLVFIYTCFPGMIEAGKVFAGCPPLYSITYTKGPKKGQTVHVADEAERDRFVDRYVKGGNDLGDLNIQRSKGLGEDNADEIEWLDPKTRKVRVITVDDVDEAKAQAEGALQLLFSARQEDRAARRVWIDDTFEKEVD